MAMWTDSQDDGTGDGLKAITKETRSDAKGSPTMWTDSRGDDGDSLTKEARSDAEAAAATTPRHPRKRRQWRAGPPVGEQRAAMLRS